MGTDSFCLRWHDFESNISHGFRDIYNAKDFMDVSLVCEGSALQAHKVVLSACSSVLYDILKTHPHAHPLLYMKGVRFSDLQSILSFMYNGEVSLPQEELNSFLDVAEDLKIKGLTSSSTGVGPTPPGRNKPSTPTPDMRTPGGRSTPLRVRPVSPNNLLAPPSKKSRLGCVGMDQENMQQEIPDDGKSIKSEPESKVSRSDDGSLLECNDPDPLNCSEKAYNTRERKERYAEKRRERLEKYSKRMEVFKKYLLTKRLDLDHIEPKKKKDVKKNYLKALEKNYLVDDQGALLFKNERKDYWVRVITDENKIQSLFKEYHSKPLGGHRIAKNLNKIIAEKYTWAGIVDDCREYVECCVQCQHTKI